MQVSNAWFDVFLDTCACAWCYIMHGSNSTQTPEVHTSILSVPTVNTMNNYESGQEKSSENKTLEEVLIE